VAVENKPHDPVEALLDAALKSYAESEPLNELEERILKRVSLMPSGGRFKYGPLLAIGATLMLSCLFVGSFHHKRIEPKTEVLAVVHVAPKSQISLSRAVKIRRPRPSRRLPKREVFPAPQPPSADELALLHFIKRYPKEAAEAFAGLQRPVDTPLEIKPLEIKPLHIDESNN
jgi:hypothetical protein